MSKIDDKLNEVLGIVEEPNELEVIQKETKDLVVPEDKDPDIDFETGRKNLYNLIDKGNEAIDGILNLAKEGEHPRAYEVAGQLIKSVADTTDKLMDLQKKVKEVEEDANKTTNNVTNNALFVGSTSELSKILKKGFLNNKEAPNPKNEKV